VADHDDDPGDVDLRHGVEDVEDHGAAAEEVEGLGPHRVHARPFPGCQDHGGEPASFHGAILN
jgi:hypothetical protein